MVVYCPVHGPNTTPNLVQRSFADGSPARGVRCIGANHIHGFEHAAYDSGIRLGGSDVLRSSGTSAGQGRLSDRGQHRDVGEGRPHYGGSDADDAVLQSQPGTSHRHRRRQLRQHHACSRRTRFSSASRQENHHHRNI